MAKAANGTADPSDRAAPLGVRAGCGARLVRPRRYSLFLLADSPFADTWRARPNWRRRPANPPVPGDVPRKALLHSASVPGRAHPGTHRVDPGQATGRHTASIPGA